MFISTGCISAYVLNLIMFVCTFIAVHSGSVSCIAVPWCELRGNTAQSYEMKFGIAGYCFALPDSVW